VLEMRRAIKDVPGQAITLRNIGECYGHLGNKTKALEFYNQSLDTQIRASLNAERQTMARASLLGRVYASRRVEMKRISRKGANEEATEKFARFAPLRKLCAFA
jgi:Tfp pilus assembly protein PilF